MYRKVRGREGVVIPNVIQRIADTAYIPMDEGNVDWVEYQKWLAEGNTPEEPES